MNIVSTINFRMDNRGYLPYISKEPTQPDMSACSVNTTPRVRTSKKVRT